MFIGVAGSIILYNAFSYVANVGPDPGTAKILEEVRINQVTKNNDTNSYTIYFQNTGQVNETIDSIYVLDANGNLIRVIPLNTSISLSPNQHTYINITIPTGTDTSNWVYFQAFTTRGGSDQLEATPIGPTYLSIFGGPSLSIINEATNLPNLNNTGIADNITFDTNSMSSFTAPAIHANRAWDALTNNEVGSGGADIHLQHDGAVICTVIIPNPFQLLNLNGSIHIFVPGGSSGLWTLTIYNWYTGWATSSPAYVQGNYTGGYFDITFFLDENNLYGYVNQNGTLQFKIALDHGATGTCKFTFNDVNIIPTYRGSYDGIFVFNITAQFTSIQSLKFDSRLACNVSNAIIQFRIYNVQAGAWEIIDNYPLITAGNFYNFSTIITQNCQDYIDPISKQVKIEFAPYSALSTDVSIKYDQVEMTISGIVP
jgi:hypothetical protein